MEQVLLVRIQICVAGAGAGVKLLQVGARGRRTRGGGGSRFRCYSEVIEMVVRWWLAVVIRECCFRRGGHDWFVVAADGVAVVLTVAELRRVDSGRGCHG